ETCALPVWAPLVPVADIYPVVVSALGGVSTATAASDFTEFPGETQIQPAQGPSSGGQSFTLSGSGFQAGSTTVDFCNPAGCPQATAILVSSDGLSLSGLTPAHAAGTVTVNVQVGQVSSGQLTYRFIDPPTVTGLNPGFSFVGQSPLVTVSGSNLVGVSGVSFGSLAGVLESVAADGLSLLVR